MSTRPLRVLVVDDNALNCDLIQFQLQDVGLTVDIAQDGEQALRILSVTPYKLVFLDLHMPVLGGREAIRQLRANPGPNRYSPVIALTAQALEVDIPNLLADGFSEVMFKPLEPDGLVAILERFCPNKRIKAVAHAPPPAGNAWLYILERANGSASLAKLLLEKLLDELPREMRQIGYALHLGRRAVALEMVHKLHGSAAYYGLAEIKDAADALERILMSQEASTQQAAYSRFAAAVDDFLRQRSAIMAEAELALHQSTGSAAPPHPIY